MFNASNLFLLARFLFVLGFTLTVIRYTNNLIEFKSPRAENREKLMKLGIYGAVIGLVIGLTSLFSPIQNEAITLKGIGTDIIAIGFSCIFQCKFTTKKQQVYLKRGAFTVIIVGFVLGVVSVFASVYKWF